MQEINLYQLLSYYLKRWYVVLGFTILGLIAGFIYNSYIQQPSYKSSAIVFVTGPEQSSISKDSTIINNYLELMTSRRVLQPVIDELKLNKSYDQIVGSVTTTNQKDTSVIKLEVSTDNPETSKNIANGTIESFKKQTKDLYGSTNIQIIDGASMPTSPYNVRKNLQLILSASAGFLLGVIILFFIYDYKNSMPATNKARSRNSKLKSKNLNYEMPERDKNGRFTKKKPSIQKRIGKTFSRKTSKTVKAKKK